MNRTPGYGAALRPTLIRAQKRRWLIQTAGRWPWKSESAKECVTTHLPNQLALKMDGAERAAHTRPSGQRARTAARVVRPDE